MKKRTSYTVDTIFVLVLFAVFAITVLFVLMSGAGVYKNTQLVMQERYEERTCLSYISSKINNNDDSGKIRVIDNGDMSVLAIDESVAGESFTTYIYCYDGYMKELLVQSDLEFNAEMGTNIAALQYINFTKDGNLINIKCIGEEGTVSTVSLNIASGLEGEV